MNQIEVSCISGGFFTRWATKEAKPKKVKVLVAQALCNLMDCSPPGSLVHGILQPRTLESVAIPSSRGSSQSRDQTQISCIAGRFFTAWATLRKSINCYQDIRLWPLKGAHLKKGNTWKARVVEHWWFLNKESPKSFPSGTVVKNPPANAGDARDTDSISGLGRSLGEGNGNLLQYYCLENSINRGAWAATVCGIIKSRTWLIDGEHTDDNTP